MNSKTRLTGLISIACTAALSACTIPASEEVAAPATSAALPTATTTSRIAPEDAFAELAEELEELIASVNDEYEVDAGIALSDGEHVAHAGVDGESSAWSTIKVPIAIAATQNGLEDDSVIELAITESDNDASRILWNFLGDTETAALAAEEVMVEGNGPSTLYDTVTTYYGSSFGNASWPLINQARFAANLECIDGAGPTYAAMGDIVEWQSDGLAGLDDAHVKGGWSDELETANEYLYTYRQLGAVVTDSGTVGVAIIAHPDDGSHETARAALDELTAAFKDMLDDDRIPTRTEC
ncbi:hypothetical protein C3B44_06150 [Corynebacterium yudongzhengii]|uniref:Serine hydrolase n=1 Tax=Corynebacterium yudongzhengii TaxID=2080740 RepID=A0A2U1T651_9CORY|nr:hypothetical protein [Corynebacterium yudongzhengii]AWB81983.1 hypothetical protein C3B44_06150 [Corynebacterium yudongzhengii]PWC01445.1 hypothetical protein DF222_07235 [Corynebacterium yudongzhengii]